MLLLLGLVATRRDDATITATPDDHDYCYRSLATIDRLLYDWSGCRYECQPHQWHKSMQELSAMLEVDASTKA